MKAEPTIAATPAVLVCPSCGGEVAPSLLSCPSCHRLVHSGRLKELAESAEAAERGGDLSTALAAWREAIALLPATTRQRAIISGRIAGLSRQVETMPGFKAAPAVPSANPAGSTPANRDIRWAGGAATGVVGTLAVILLKSKVLALFLLTKAKFLLLGLTKASTFFSMLGFFGVYWSMFGAWFAMGLVLSIYIHEMGHVAVLMRFGVPATAPLFIPGLGAVIRLQQTFINPREDARVGLAGPIWGCGAALACAAAYVLTDYPLWGALARVGAWINLFNLIPVWQLDGSRAFHSLTRSQRWLAVTAVATAWAITEEGLLVLVMAVGAFRAALDRPADEPDSGALGQFIAVLAVLSALLLLPVRLPGR